MYCAKCGEKQNIGANFCSRCGLPLKKLDERTQGFESQNNELTEVDALELYVGDNSDYYFEKWGIYENAVKKRSWNWAAFFLIFLWLGYRKMYKVIFGIILIWLVTDVILYSLDLYSEGTNLLIGILTGVFLGIKGNYLYYKQATGKIKKFSTNGKFSKQEILNTGGRSPLGIFGALGMLLLYSLISAFLIAPMFAPETVEFGYHVENGELIDPIQIFEPNEEMYYSFKLPDQKGGKFTIIIESFQGSTSQVYEQFEDKVPPELEGMHKIMRTPEDIGEYVMKVIQNGKVVAIGVFFVF
ncbi:DUF2628 domain-containing protein [Bacillus sp. JJ1562]|uniref:DUF2628 domain-containing protein n=1 Tax=Bacillus sp. JJ1562 TaxID=3122960 RepID=UPI00300165FA